MGFHAYDKDPPHMTKPREPTITDDIAALIEEAEHMLAILECRATEEMGGYDYVRPKIEKAKAALRALAQENEQLKATLDDMKNRDMRERLRGKR